MRTFAFCAAIIFGLTTATKAASTNSDWFVLSWQTDNGLPHNTINGVVQTSDGYLWLGTPSGLVNFDGVRFQKFELTDSIFGGNRGIVTMIRSGDGGLWLAMNRGAVVYLNGSRTKVFTTAEGLADGQVHELAEAGDGTLWISFVGGQGRCIKDGKVMNLPPNENSTNLFSVASDAKGNIWGVTSGAELAVYRDGKFHRLAHVTDGMAKLAAAKNGGIWVCSGTHLLHFDVDGRMKDCGDFNADHTSGSHNALMEDSHGAVWIGTAFGGLIRYDGAKFETIATSRPEIQSVLEDYEGNIWAGTVGGGLNRIRQRVVQIQGTESGLPFETVRSLCEDAQGTVWAVTENGMLARHFDAGWQSVSTNENWKRYNLSCVTSDFNGGLWLGARNRKLLHWREGQDAPEETQLLGTAFSLVACTNGDVWMGEIAGMTHVLQHLHDGKLTTHKLAGDIRTIRAAVQDASGTIWFASARGDLLRIQGNEVIKEPLPESDAGLSIRCLAATADGALWIGYESLGVGWLKDGRYYRIGTAQGLFDNYISQIISDNDGWLWFGSDHGIFKAREKDLEAVIDGKLSHVDCVRYGPDEGAANLQANFGAAPGVLRSRDGRLWIPTRSGLAVVNPTLIQNDAKLLSVLLTQVVVDERTVARRKTVADEVAGIQAIPDLSAGKIKLRLPPDYRRLRIEFTALSFAGMDNIRFRYRLVGFDQDWQEVGEQRYATYSRLPAGDYTFEVRACNSEGVWNGTGSEIAFIVSPFFWNTWWFRILSGFLLLAIIVGYVRYFEVKRTQRQLARLEHEHAIERERARIAKDIHDDLGANLTEITLLSELARSPGVPADEMRTDIHHIADKARRLTHSLDEIVWAVNPRNDTLDSFVTYACLYAEDFLKTAKIRCRLKIPGKIPHHSLATNVRHNLFLAVKEALNNIVKHANASEVNLFILLLENGFELGIRDNGRGFEAKKTLVKSPGGNGLSNMRQRMNDIGGALDLQSVSGEGTIIRLVVRFSNE